MSAPHEIVVVGLGPGDPGLLTLEAAELLRSERVFLRTRIHPTLEQMPDSVRWPSFDHLYERAEGFAQLYERIVDELIAATAEGPLVYAVPGHPLFAEATVRLLLDRGRTVDNPVRIVPGVSFVDVAVTALALDPIDANIQLVDALDLVAFLDREPFAGGTLPLSPLRPALITQVYAQPIASATKLALLKLFPPDTPVTVMTALGTAAHQIDERPLSELDHGAYDHLTTLYLPALDPLLHGTTSDALQRVVARLRAPGGCPWDREQTHESLVRYLIEESYEAIEAIERDDSKAVEEELGDVLLQVYLHAQIAEESGDFSLEDVFQTLCAKLVRRHPHVFGSHVAETPGEVVQTWNQIKAEEKNAGGAAPSGDGKPANSVLGDLPASLPALARAQRLLQRSRAAGLGSWPTEGGTPSTVMGIAAELARIVSTAEAAGIDAEQALRGWTQEYIQATAASQHHART